MLLVPMMSKKGGRKMGGMTAKISQEDLEIIKELFEAGKVTPIIDRRYPLSEVPEAIRYLEAGHARGKVVIQIEGSK
jgi:NADPH:quinone reductase-like Zn-dependent oxidoreductase